MYYILSLAKFFMTIIPVLLSVAFITLLERKVLSLTGVRVGPNKVSFQGILQPIADAVKLANKSVNLLTNYSMLMYYLTVIFMFMMTILLWSLSLNWGGGVAWKFSMLVLMLLLGISAMKSILAGWSTFSKYSLIGSMRTVSQMISYESVIYLCILGLIWVMKSFSILSLTNQEFYLIYFLLPLFMYFWIPSVLAELNRTPYDFSEGESELVSGFNTEFGSKSFTLIFLSEYSNIIFFMMMTTILFFHTSYSFTSILIFSFLNFSIIWIRSTLPRMRFDKFMMNAWKFFIPTMTLLVMYMLISVL